MRALAGPRPPKGRAMSQSFLQYRCGAPLLRSAQIGCPAESSTEIAAVSQWLRGPFIPGCRSGPWLHGNDNFPILVRGVDLKMVACQDEDILRADNVASRLVTNHFLNGHVDMARHQHHFLG